MVNNPLISTKQTTTSHFNSLNTKKTVTHDVRNPGPGLGQAQQYDWVKLFPGIPTHPLLKHNLKRGLHSDAYMVVVFIVNMLVIFLLARQFPPPIKLTTIMQLKYSTCDIENTYKPIS